MIVVVIVICLTLTVDQQKTARLQAHTSSIERLSTYKHGIASWWGYACMASLMIPPSDLFIAAGTKNDMAWLRNSQLMMGVATTILVIYFSLAFMPAIHCSFKPKTRLSYWKALHSYYFLFPVSKQERHWWVLLSLTAGICEEIFFRGFLLQFIHGQSHASWYLDLNLALVLSALVFGICHYYQGISGIVRTTVGGLLFGLLTILTNSLWLPILLHVLVDLAVLLIYKPQQDSPEAAKRLMAGCEPESVRSDILT
ncbi:CPBP family intramembrane glutamic endopeptidase [Undibacterium sp. Di27W]|uniref:CPBP family intramembrane glutamic endopeptidase n=1 Tax=Undibacterium sp. Di27W TaxID=3413036 RepID=UPI003BF3671A